MFQRYAQEHPEVAALTKQENQQDWQWVQKRFEKLQLHRKQPNGLNIWTCEVTGPRKSRRLHGYLLEDGSLALAEIPTNNPYLALTQEGRRDSGIDRHRRVATINAPRKLATFGELSYSARANSCARNGAVLLPDVRATC